MLALPLMSVGLMLGASSPGGPTPLTLGSVFGDHMVLQRDANLRVWGRAEGSRVVTVRLGSQEASAESHADGWWEVRLEPLPAGGPHELTASCGSQEIVLSDVLIGDVWLASGQSNMEWHVAEAANGSEEVAAAVWPQIRLLTVPHQVAGRPRERTDTSGWQPCSPESVADFSAVAYFFGRELHRHLQVPIGLINSSWGGTPMESWTPLEALEMSPEFAQALADHAAFVQEWGWLEEGNTYEELLALWRSQVNGQGQHVDFGRDAATADWASPDFDDSTWAEIETPGIWEMNGLALVDGALWFRRTVEIPPSWAGRDLTLSLGPIDDDDITFFNGVEVGRTGPAVNSFLMPRVYTVPGAIVEQGPAVIACRVWDGAGAGGFLGPEEDMCLLPGEGEGTPLSLAGPWRQQAERALQQDPRTAGVGIFVSTPCVLYNAMIDPLVPFAIRGVIWYQGESNVARATEYRDLSERMITAWRQAWGTDFPFLLVVLAGFDEDWPLWPDLQWAQVQTAREVPGVGMAVATDIGTAHNIHPPNKQELGRRLALTARALAYGEDVECSGPVCREARREDDHIVLTFDHAEGGLELQGTRLEFDVLSQEGVWTPAEAEISGETVILTGAPVAAAVKVRHNWNDWPEGFLTNAQGLPAAIFLIDVTNSSR